jgi:hypothetical protein
MDEALEGPYGMYWWRAMLEEYDALVEKGTFKMSDLPDDRRAIGCK